jgi:hypothetical protein
MEVPQQVRLDNEEEEEEDGLTNGAFYLGRDNVLEDGP